nr:MAG TPA: hypothetical protein [Caudoviricetes sp.]
MGFGYIAIVNFTLGDLKALLSLGVTLAGVFHFAHDRIIPLDNEDVRSFFDGLFHALGPGGLLCLGGLLLGDDFLGQILQLCNHIGIQMPLGFLGANHLGDCIHIRHCFISHLTSQTFSAVTCILSGNLVIVPPLVEGGGAGVSEQFHVVHFVLPLFLFYQLAANAILIFLSGVFTVAPENVLDNIIEVVIWRAIAIHNEGHTLIHGRHIVKVVHFIGISPHFAIAIFDHAVQELDIVPVKILAFNNGFLDDGSAQNVAPSSIGFHTVCTGGACSGNRQGKNCGHQKDSGDCHYHGTGGLLQRFQNGFHNDVPHDVSFFDLDSNSGACYSCIA